MTSTAQARFHIRLRLVGAACVVLSCLAIAYTVSYYLSLRPIENTSSEPYFSLGYFSQAGTATILHCSLAYVGLQLCLANARYRWWLIVLFVLDIVHVSVGGFVWAKAPEAIASSFAAASGAAGGGLTIKWLLLFPFWSSATLFWPRR